jgi:hypothetical protein
MPASGEMDFLPLWSQSVFMCRAVHQELLDVATAERASAAEPFG